MEEKQIRWTPAKKADVVTRVSCGDISVSEAMKQYKISLDELSRWNFLFKNFGLEGLKTTRIGKIRKKIEEQQGRHTF